MATCSTLLKYRTISMKMKNNSGDEFEVIHRYKEKIGSRVWDMWVIRFSDTGTVKTVYKTNAIKGKAKDPYKPSFYGVGYSGEPTPKPYIKQVRRLWSNMIKRCYDKNYEAGYYGRGYTVEKRWLCFANFLEDVSKLNNFNKWLEGHKPNKPKYNLDKDLILEGNKIYCREFCSFVPEGINKAAGARNGKPFSKNPKK